MRVLFIFLLTLITFSGFGQCQWERFKAATDESTEAGKLLTDAIDEDAKLVNAWEVLDNAEITDLSDKIDDIRFVSNYLENNPGKAADQVSADIKNKGWQQWVHGVTGGGKLSFEEKIKLFIKKENALLTYERQDGIFFMQKTTNNDLGTGYSNELTFSFKYKTGPNINSKDMFGKIGLTEEGYLIGNLKKPTGMNNQQIKGVSEDALDMALYHFGRNNVNGIKALWVKNSELYPDLPDNKSINLIRFEEALERMDESMAVFETITGDYARSRGFGYLKEVKKLTENVDGIYGYEVIFEIMR
ncbi:hypothetical protein JMN32_09620 [Fulvivirga sp. 29W222]|uniref:Uncharacterized protein n=1 Tax=Fulvivirga marina TaxID=2494733 RepID=A0A937KDU2_9BACT|nr:hypothetical protein [Fulvivirga marina]MBL6446568.1 hypothetical protein [Fulvivirga marina]